MQFTSLLHTRKSLHPFSVFTVLYKLMPTYFFMTIFHQCLVHFSSCRDFALCPVNIACFHVSVPLSMIPPQPLPHLLGCFFFFQYYMVLLFMKTWPIPLPPIYLLCSTRSKFYLYLQFLQNLLIIKYVDICYCSG